ncbi:MAG: phosphatidylserine/phosphatidylglycerophosphate/cardiolipin synthase family protein [Bacteroidota bacterium]
MRKISTDNKVKFLLDNEFIKEVHEQLIKVEVSTPDEETFVSIGMWSADLETKLPPVGNQPERTLKAALYSLNQKKHHVRIILWAGSTISGITGNKERQKALKFQNWAKDKAYVSVYLEPYKSALSTENGLNIGSLVGLGLNWMGMSDFFSTVSAAAVTALARGNSALGLGASTHQKIIICSKKGKLCSIIGGFNLGNEYSCEPNHSRDGQYWHDTAVSLTGQAAAGVYYEWVRRWKKQGVNFVVDDKTTLSQGVPGKSNIILASTNSEKVNRENDIRNLMVEQIRNARESIYIENYAFTDPALVEALTHRLEQGNIQVIVMINHPKSELFEANTTWSYFQAGIHQKLKEANGGQGVMYAARTAYTRTSSRGVTYKCWPYPHSKLAIFDNTTLVVGSANWTYRSMEYDGEISAFITDEELVPQISQKLLSHWWQTKDGNGPDDIDVAEWIRVAKPSDTNKRDPLGCRIEQLVDEDFEDWKKLSKTKQATLSVIWTMF